MGEEKARWIQRFENYEKALRRLAEIVNESNKRELNDFERDCIVKRFEFTFECSWRLMKSYAESQGEDEIGASRDSIRRAFKLHIIDDGDVWMEMIKWRNETSHNYNGEVADTAIDNIRQTFYPLMVTFCHKMASLMPGVYTDLFMTEN